MPASSSLPPSVVILAESTQFRTPASIATSDSNNNSAYTTGNTIDHTPQVCGQKEEGNFGTSRQALELASVLEIGNQHIAAVDENLELTRDLDIEPHIPHSNTSDSETRLIPDLESPQNTRGMNESEQSVNQNINQNFGGLAMTTDVFLTSARANSNALLADRLPTFSLSLSVSPVVDNRILEADVSNDDKMSAVSFLPFKESLIEESMTEEVGETEISVNDSSYNSSSPIPFEELIVARSVQIAAGHRQQSTTREEKRKAQRNYRKKRLYLSPKFAPEPTQQHNEAGLVEMLAQSHKAFFENEKQN